MSERENALKVYCAGPMVFLSNARELAARQIEICREHGFVGRPPLDVEVTRTSEMSDEDFGLEIFKSNIRLMRECDIIIANLTPFRGPSADSGTVFELGWFAGAGKPAYAYSNINRSFQERTREHLEVLPDPIDGVQVESFGSLPDNLMIPGGLLAGGLDLVVPEASEKLPFDSLIMFERCVRLVAARLGIKQAVSQGSSSG